MPAPGPFDADPDERARREDLDPLATLVADRRRAALARRGDASADGWIVAVAGGVASGKSTIARGLAQALRARGIGPVVHVSTDGYLFSNAELERRGLTARKGFPETYDTPALLDLLRAVRAGDRAVRVPTYSHRVQDIVPDDATVVDRPAVLVLEGLRALAGPLLADPSDGASRPVDPSADRAPGVADLVDLGIYVDAAEDDARAWYLERFRAWRVAAADDPGALLHRIADMPDADADALALRVWDETNAPNVRDHVLPTRDRADVVLQKGPDHRIEQVLVRPV